MFDYSLLASQFEKTAKKAITDRILTTRMRILGFRGLRVEALYSIIEGWGVALAASLAPPEPDDKSAAALGTCAHFSSAASAERFLPWL
jgi:hypothetical protein